MQQHMSVIGVDKTRQHKGKEAGLATPDILMDLARETRGPNTVVTEILKRTGTRREDLCHIHASPDCDPESILQRMERAQNRGKGIHAGERRPAEQEKAIQEIVKGIQEAIKRDPTVSYTVEQPKETALKDHPALSSLPGEVKIVKACCYGYGWQKQTRIWTNLGTWWQPECTHGPKWLQKCNHCQACRENKPHDMHLIRRGPHDQRPGAKLPGLSAEAARNRIPPRMAAEWAQAAVARQKAMRSNI